MNRTAFKLAASTVIVSMTMVACTAQSEAMRRSGATASAEAQDYREAARHHEKAVRSLQSGDLGEALQSIENAVAFSPHDVGYRLLLADIYLKSGRFESARTSFADVVELDPSNVRAGLSLALMQIALGRPQAAVAQLDQLDGRASAADLGLAYSLAGLPERGIEILEPAARGFDATPRIRQNLALSYALAGNWARARAVAAQDVSPAELGARLQQWAAMARPDAAAVQVASLLGVDPREDPGQPVRLALAPAQAEPAVDFAEAAPSVDDFEAPVALASAAPAQEPVSDWGLAETAEAPAAVIAAAPAPEPVETASYYLPPPPAPEPRDEAEQAQAEAAATLTRPQPQLIRAASVSLPAPVFRREAVRPARAEILRGDSRFVVQLGAFSNEGNAERAWQQADGRFELDAHVPLTTTINLDGRILHRVSVAGFASRDDASRLCSSIRAQGGECFVRANAGDASVRWAARYAEDADNRA